MMNDLASKTDDALIEARSVALAEGRLLDVIDIDDELWRRYERRLNALGDLDNRGSKADYKIRPFGT